MQGMQSVAANASRLLKALANADRLLLLCQLKQGEHGVSEMETLAGVLQPLLSQQLAVLRQEGLVTTRREGKQIFTALPAKTHWP